MTPPEFIIVLVSAPDGTRIDATRTDAEGKVELEVPPGSTVTAMAESRYTEDGQPQTYTSIISWFDVPDIDPLYMDISKTSGDLVTEEPERMDIAVNLVANIAGTSGDAGLLNVLCNNKYYPPNVASTGFSGSSAVADVTPCPGANEIEVWGFARGGWAYGTVSMDPGASKSLALVADDTRWDTTSLFLDGIPAGAESLSYYAWGVMNTSNIGLTYSKTLWAPLYSQGTVSVDIPHAPFHQVIKSASIEVQREPRITTKVMRSGAEELEWNVTEDLALFEAISPVDRQVSDRPAVNWRIADVGKLGDYVRLSLWWRDVHWVAYVPPARQGTVQLPVLPAAPRPFEPLPQDEVYAGGASMYDELLLEGYAEAMGKPLDAASSNYNRTSISP